MVTVCNRVLAVEQVDSVPEILPVGLKGAGGA